MPLITSPNLWSKINFFKKKIERQERAHKDGININYESPEAFEEIFWRSQLNISYKDKIIFDKNLYSTEIAEEFKKFIKLINLKNKKNIYLSKNNSNIIRIKFLLNNLEKKKNINSF